MAVEAGDKHYGTTVLEITGMDCADCAATIGRNVGAMPGVKSAEVSFAAGRMVVSHDDAVTVPEIISTVEESGYGAVVAGKRLSAEEARQRFWLRNRRAIASAAACLLTLAGLITMLAGLSGIPQILFALALISAGYHVARSGVFALLRSGAFDMNVLMSTAAIGAVAIGQWGEAAVAMTLFALGNTLESYTMDRARNAVRALMTLAPAEARVRRGDQRVTLPADAIQVGDIVVVSPGERMPVDGRVIAGSSMVNQAPITGESSPVAKSAGDEVFAGTLNSDGYLEVRVSKPYQENTINRIVHLIEEAQSKKAPTERFVDGFARRYTPAVLVIAGLIALAPWLVFSQPFEPWFYRALVMLVIACPCALVISTPVSIVAGIARSARDGVLIKGGAYLEAAGAVKAVAFDKTGTLTYGRPEVVEVVAADGASAEEVMRVAGAIEGQSGHPLALAIQRYQRHAGKAIEAADDFASLTGRGARAIIDGQVCHIGSARLLAELGIGTSELTDQLARHESAGRSMLLVAVDSRCIGLVAVQDQIRPEARSTIETLHRAGIRPVVMLTGDNERVAQAIAEQVGVDEVRAGLLPEHKVAAINELTARYGPVAMVGDGVNDGPALAAATVGIAMGVAGSDVALETADIALMADELEKVPEVIALSQATLRTIRQNIAISLATKGLFLVLGALGIAGLWVAVLADMGTSLLVTANGMRLLRFQTQRQSTVSVQREPSFTA